jgi:Flp pilus assembly protein TadG
MRFARDDGAAAVLAAAFVVCLVMVGLALASVAAVWLQRQRLQTAVEVAALREARRAFGVCATADALARAEGAVVTQCLRSAGRVRVSMRRSTGSPWPITMNAVAVAGPVSAIKG